MKLRDLPRLAALLLPVLAVPGAVSAQKLPCMPCAGLATGEPEAALEALRQAPSLEGDPFLVVAWTVELDGSAATAPAEELAALGATPWLTLRFRSPAPLLAHLDRLTAELEEAARLVREAPPGAWFQIGWEPESLDDPEAEVEEYAFLLKRAAVAVTGAARGTGTRVVSRPLAADPEALDTLYEQDVAAYLDALAVAPAPEAERAAAVEQLTRLDPGKPLISDAVPLPEEPELALAAAAEEAAAGFSLSLFRTPRPDSATAAALAAMAREHAGDLAFDPYSTPAGAEGAAAWAFVRGEDLALRVIARPASSEREAGELALTFSDTQLRRPARVDLAGGEPIPLAGERRTREGYELRVADPGAVALLRLERPTLAEMAGEGGLVEAVEVAGERQMPVEEILRRLQAVEDAQSRRLDHFQAVNTTHLRFQFGTGTQTLEATYEGDFFFRREEGFDWAWQRFYVNGVRWRDEKIPEIPLIRPEKAAAMPLEISFSPEYVYRLRGTGTAEGRDCWVVDFRPREVVEGHSLYQGTVWIDRELFMRVRTRAVQLGLSGDVISNEETTTYSPVGDDGEPTAWAPGTLTFPLRATGQEIFSLLNATVVVEKETLLSGLVLNAPDFDERRREVLASEVTMVRDTEGGLRYLVKDKDTGERVVQEEADLSRLFLAGGVFFDESQDFPLPLAGVNYFNFDWRGTGGQVNAFFAGALASLDYADPSLAGSRWDIGADVFALGVSGSDDQFRNGREVPEEEVEQRFADVDLTLGRPIGQFFKFSFVYQLQYIDYSRADDTDPEFVLPRSHFDQALALEARYSRKGWRLAVEGSSHRRSDWGPWGLPGSGDFDPEDEDYLLWSASLGKNWYLPGFRKIGAEIEYVDGQDLDRFSKYQFGFFSDVRVHGYQSDRVRAQRALATHWTYGFEVGEFLRLDGVLDAAWADDDELGLDREFLAGVGVAGTFVGPWRTVVNLDLGVPVAGPDDGFSIFLVFLKLFR